MTTIARWHVLVLLVVVGGGCSSDRPKVLPDDRALYVRGHEMRTYDHDAKLVIDASMDMLQDIGFVPKYDAGQGLIFAQAEQPDTWISLRIESWGEHGTRVRVKASANAVAWVTQSAGELEEEEDVWEFDRRFFRLLDRALFLRKEGL